MGWTQIAMRRLRTPFLLATLLTAAGARADVERIQLDYEAPDACPPRSSFEAEVRARTSKVELGSSGRRFSVRLEHGEAAWVGLLTISDEDGGQSERTLDGAACEDVVSALALVTALAVDPDASTAPRAELGLSAPTKAEPEPEPKPEPEREPPRAPAQTKPVERRPAPAEPEPSRSWELGLGSRVVTGPAPSALFAAGPALRIVQPTRYGEPSLGLALFAAQSGVVGPDVAEARFRWLAALLDACPLGRSSGLRFRACAALSGGVIQAEGRTVANPEARSRAFVAGGVEGAIGYGLGQRFFVDLGASALANFTRDDFVFENPRIVVHQVPFATFSAGLGLGAKIP